MAYYSPKGLARDIFQKRYALYPSEVWDEACERVANHVASAENADLVYEYRYQFSEVLKENKFMPGGRIWAGSGRPRGQLLNCFVVPTADSSQGWAKTVHDVIVISAKGGGVGINCSPARPAGSRIAGNGGESTGAIGLMRMINAVGQEIKAGGGRRTALMLCLDLNHGDIDAFLEAKLDLNALTNANVSVVFNENPEAFFERVRSGDSEASEVWNKIVEHALKSGEPGILNGYHANQMSNVAYLGPLTSTNPCFSKDTMVQTREGHFPIETLVGKTVEVWNGHSWQEINNFRVTGRRQKMLRIEMQDGSFERVTPYHTVVLEDGNRVEARNLKVGTRLADSNAPETHGSIRATGAYLKGFLVADGTQVEDRPALFLYGAKNVCESRLLNSARELPAQLRTNAIEEPSFGQPKNGRSWMKGLGSRKEELSYWVTEGKRTIPDEVFAWDSESKAEFIAGVFDGDGSILDSDNAYGYQISSVSRNWLLRLQLLLNTFGVRSKISLAKPKGKKDFGDRGGLLDVQELWRLSIAQAGSIKLSKVVKFERLKDFSDREIVYNVIPRRNTVVAIEEDGVDDEVFCCTVDGTHAFGLSSGFYWGQCGEIWLMPYDCCCLGAVVLPRFVVDGDIDWTELKRVVKLGVRFLDDVLSVNTYPLPEIQETCSNIRRIGLGVMGLHDMLLLLGHKYNSDAGIELVDKVMKFIKNTAYEASVELAVEKGPFPKFDAEEFSRSKFVKTLKPSIRSAIREKGIRNCALLTIAPTGTTSMVSAVTSGIEPMFSPAYKRKYRDGDALREETVVHPLLKEFVSGRRSTKHFQGAFDLKLRDHFEMQRVCQRHLDNACSKTINLPPGTGAEELSKLYMEYLPELKGVTVYPEGSRENQPLTPIPLDEAIKLVKEEAASTEEAFGQDTCKDGKCDI